MCQRRPDRWLTWQAIGRAGRRVSAAFEPNSDDFRDSPALNVAAQLQLQGGVVRVTDPAAVENCQKLWPQLDYAATAEEAAEGADAVLVLTEWQDYRNLDPVAFGRVVKQKRVLDGRNALDRRSVDSRRLVGPGAGPPRRLKPVTADSVGRERIRATWGELPADEPELPQLRSNRVRLRKMPTSVIPPTPPTTPVRAIADLVRDPWSAPCGALESVSLPGGGGDETSAFTVSR